MMIANLLIHFAEDINRQTGDIWILFENQFLESIHPTFDLTNIIILSVILLFRLASAIPSRIW